MVVIIIILNISIFIILGKFIKKARDSLVAAVGYICEASFFKKTEFEYCLCYPSSSLICNEEDDDVKNLHSIKFTNSELGSKLVVNVHNSLVYKKLQQLPIHDYNTYIIDLVNNLTTAGRISLIIGLGIIILFSVIISIVKLLILHMDTNTTIPWIKIDGRPVMPGPFNPRPHYWINCPTPRPIEPHIWPPSEPNPRPFPLKDPGKENKKN